LKSVQKDDFFNAPFDLFKERNFYLLEVTMNLFEELKRLTMEETAQYFKKRVSMNRSWIFICAGLWRFMV
jgi:hypothetical protein